MNSIEFLAIRKLQKDSKATDFATTAVEPAQLSDECVTAGKTPLKIVYDHGDNITIHIDDSIAKSEIDTIASAHTPA